MVPHIKIFGKKATLLHFSDENYNIYRMDWLGFQKLGPLLHITVTR